jgi:hypothetical protein
VRVPAGYKPRDVLGLVVAAVWTLLHLSQPLLGHETPAGVDNAMLIVLGWWPAGTVAEALAKRGTKGDDS